MNVAEWAAYAAAKLSLPQARAIVEPDPQNNEWKMAAVGQPLWLSTTGSGSVSTTVTEQGITIHMSARAVSTTFDLGDGTTLTCQHMTRRPTTADPHAASPDCGHTYQHAADYTIRTTTWWTVTWNALDQSGTLQVPRTATTPLTVGELHSVITTRS